MPDGETFDHSLVLPDRSTVKAWVVCVTASLFFFFEFVQMMMFNAINPSLMREFHITATSVGMISSAYFLANIIFMFPAGILLDRFSTRKIIIVAMFLCVGGTLVFSLSTNIYMAAFARFLTGVGGSFPFLCCLRLCSRWFPARRWALVTGVVVTVAFLGGAFGQAPMTILVEHFGWRDALRVDAFLGVLFIGLIYLNVQDCPENFRGIIFEKAKSVKFLPAIKTTLKNIQNWFYGLYTSMLNLSVMVLGAIYGSLYLVQVHGLSATDASFVTSMIFFGTMVGSPLIGYISDKMGLRKAPMILFAVLSIGLLIAIMYLPNLSIKELMVLFFLLGFLTSSQVISYPAISESNKHELSGSALGWASVLIMGAPALFQPLFGWMLDLGWNGKMINHVPQYSLTDFRTAFWVLPITGIVGLVMVLLAKETYARSTVKRQSNKAA
jgi:MFS family permease